MFILQFICFLVVVCSVGLIPIFVLDNLFRYEYDNNSDFDYGEHHHV